MDFIKTSKYIQGDFNQPINFDQLKTLEKVKVNQKLELLSEEKNLALFKKYAEIGLKILPIRRVSSRDWSQRKDFPNRVLLEMTSRCNMECRMCPRRNLKRPHIDFDKDLFLKIIDELDKYSVEGVWLFRLGEPILHPDWKEIVDYACKKKNIGMTWFSTNGYAFDRDCTDFILNSGITFLNYSLHGTNEETFGFVSPKKYYKDVRENLEVLLKRKKELGRGPVINIKMIDQKGTHDNIDEFLETFYQTGEVVNISFLEFTNLPNNQYDLRSKRLPVVKKCNRVSRGDCAIVTNGDVQPCDDTYNSQILLGNVKNDTVYNIWNSPPRKHLFELNEQGKMYQIEHCRECTDYNF